jgi:hypothetical protein
MLSASSAATSSGTWGSQTTVSRCDRQIDTHQHRLTDKAEEGDHSLPLLLTSSSMSSSDMLTACDDSCSSSCSYVHRTQHRHCHDMLCQPSTTWVNCSRL